MKDINCSAIFEHEVRYRYRYKSCAVRVFIVYKIFLLPRNEFKHFFCERKKQFQSVTKCLLCGSGKNAKLDPEKTIPDPQNQAGFKKLSFVHLGFPAPFVIVLFHADGCRLLGLADQTHAQQLHLHFEQSLAVVRHLEPDRPSRIRFEGTVSPD